VFLYNYFHLLKIVRAVAVDAVAVDNVGWFSLQLCICSVENGSPTWKEWQADHESAV